MRVRIAALTIATLAAVSALVVPATVAHAVSGSLACRVQPYNPTFSAPCHTSYASYNYTVNFQVTGAPAGSTFAWSIAGFTGGSSFGCGSADSFCTKYLVAVQVDRTLTANVTVTSGGVNDYLYTEALVPATCPGPYLC